MNARVLVADDDATTLGLVATALERLGCSVTRTDDGGELLQALADGGPFDLLVADIEMPWMTGLQVAQSARTAGLRTPVIIITALPIEAVSIEELGEDAVLLRKPFETRELVTLTHRLLDSIHAA